jgi:hypothetical protein
MRPGTVAPLAVCFYAALLYAVVNKAVFNITGGRANDNYAMC